SERILSSEPLSFIYFGGGTPSVLEAQQAFVVVGKNFSGKQGDLEIEIDNYTAEPLAASTRSIVAISHKHSKVGPIKEMKISRGDQISLPTEVDIAKVEMRYQSAVKGSKGIWNLHVQGSTLPCVVALGNGERQQIRFGSYRLGTQNLFLSPGGVQNSFRLEGEQNLPTEKLSVHILTNGLFDPYSLKATQTLVSKSAAAAEVKAEALRLKKREIGLEAQAVHLKAERSELLKEGKLSPNEDSRLESKERSISSRIYRLEKMLQARRVIIETYPNNDFAKLMDQAAGESLGSLESALALKDFGFTEARLLKSTGRKHTEEQSSAQLASFPAQSYNTPAPAALTSYRKKWGKRAYVPPPPEAALLIAPPAPYRPDPNDLSPFLTELPAALKTAALKGSKAKKTQLQGKSSKSKNKQRGQGSKLHELRNQAHAINKGQSPKSKNQPLTKQG
ncbi:MAG: hypothetical protein K2X27_09900, partial [Candidatus Obscuribacterales bacterium]|nr:hypothetical protein [Candidatus Obscuribacterales bacterium]